MVVLNIKVDGKLKTIYMDNKLYQGIEKKMKPKVQKKDQDLVLLVDGQERSGKSVFAAQIAKILNPNFSINDICMTPEEFTKAVIHAKKGDCIIYDEAFTGLSSRGSLSEINKMLVSLMMEMGQKNLFIIVVMPTFFMLDKYVALFRARGLFHVYKKGDKLGFWAYFNNKKKNRLYLLGKKMFSYSSPKSKFRGRFLDQYTINEQEYREKKRNALNKKSRLTKYNIIKGQRDGLIYLLCKKFELNQLQISELFSKIGYKLARNTISEIITEFEEEMKKSDEDDKLTGSLVEQESDEALA